jgi:choline kinase
VRPPVRVVVNCAGEGRRLGLGTTKALVSVLGEPLIAWHLKMLREVEDVVFVVGYQARKVIDAVRALRPDAAFAFNRDYATTGTAASLALGCHGARGDIVSLDGDLLVHPEDFRGFVAGGGPCIGVAPPNTTDAVFAVVEERGGVPSATSFNRSGDGLEWTGLLRVPGEAVQRARESGAAAGHVYEMLAAHLPLPARTVRAREIDTPEDYDRAVRWLSPIRELWAA